MGLTAAAEWVIGVPLNGLRAQGVSLATGATQNYDAECNNAEELTVNVSMTGSASGDLAVTVTPFGPDGITPLPVALTPIRATGPTFAGSVVGYTATFDVSGCSKVRIAVKNNNAATQTLAIQTRFTELSG